MKGVSNDRAKPEHRDFRKSKETPEAFGSNLLMPRKGKLHMSGLHVYATAAPALKED